MARSQRLDRALRPPKRGIWIATVAVLLSGLVALVWVNSPGERQRRDILGRLELGDSTRRVVALLGEPPIRCAGEPLTHLRASFPTGWPGASAEAALEALGAGTLERWIYPLSLRRPAGCEPAERQTEIGVGPDGRIVWYVAVMGKTELRLPESVSPAEPEGAEIGR